MFRLRFVVCVFLIGSKTQNYEITGLSLVLFGFYLVKIGLAYNKPNIIGSVLIGFELSFRG